MQGTFLGETVISSACIDKHQQLKMKFPIVILAVLGVVWGKSLPTGSLKDDLKEFLEIVPTDKVLEIALDYLSNDHEVRELVVYIQSEEFPEIHTIVEHLKEHKHCLKFINDHGVDVHAVVNEVHTIVSEIHKFLGLHPLQPTNTTRKGVGIYGLINDVIAVLPLHDLSALFVKKIETREYFKNLVTFIHSPVITHVVDTVRSWPEHHELLEMLREKVVDLDHFIELLRQLYWRGTHSIHDDVKEFMVLVPTEKVIQITLDYLANDPELHEIFAYIQSEEFPWIHTIVEYLKEYKDCLKYVNEHGVDVHAFILEIYDILGLPPYHPTHTTRIGVGIYGLIDDVIAVLPLHELKVLLHVKMETREYIKTVITTIHSHEFVNMVDTLQALPEYHELLENLHTVDFDVDPIIQHLKELIGLHHL